MDIEHHASNYIFSASQFITQLDNNLKAGLNYIEKLFTLSTQTTLSLYNSAVNESYELVGFTAFKNKLYVLNIHNIYINDYHYNASMINATQILINIHGHMAINYKLYSFTASIVFKALHYAYLIDNFILHVFIE